MNDNWTGGYTGGPTPGGSGMADYQAGAAARTLYDQSVQAQNAAHAPMNLGGSGSAANAAPVFRGVTGYVVASAVSVVILIVLGLIATTFVRETFDRAGLTRSASAGAPHSG